MYYTIEGKRVLGILYIAGLITGTLFFNITIKMQVFKVSDFLDFTEYMKMLENIDLAIFCSYVVFVNTSMQKKWNKIFSKNMNNIKMIHYA